MIKAIFYSRFDTQEGPKVVHQVPDGAIVPSPTAPPGTSTLLNFSDISFFVIPRQELCGNVIHVCMGGYRILGLPICIKSPIYDRNEFIFNFCIVLGEEEEWSSFKSVVQKLADLMCGLEEQSGLLSKDTSRNGEGKVYSLCETLMEDLNNYCECMIPIDELNTLNIKLFPLYPSPPMVKAWQVPLFTVRYEAFMDETWDLTMQRIVPYIDGVNSIRRISILADADFSLTCSAIRHLIYYGCVFILDIFTFSAIYAPTAQFGSTIASDEEMQRECARYVNARFTPISIATSPAATSTATAPLSPAAPPPNNSNPRPRRGISTTNGDSWLEQDTVWPRIDDSCSIPASGSKVNIPGTQNHVVDGVGIVELYASLKQGQTVKQWYVKHMAELANIDVRRFITFGIIKGFLYRVHKYPYATGQPAHQRQQAAANSAPVLSSPAGGVGAGMAVPTFSITRDRIGSVASGMDSAAVMKARRKSASSYRVRRRVRRHQDGGDGNEGDEEGDYEESNEDDENTRGEEEDGDGDGDEETNDYGIDDKTLAKYLDGVHCFDQICTELEVSEKELTGRLKRYPGEVVIIHR